MSFIAPTSPSPTHTLLRFSSAQPSGHSSSASLSGQGFTPSSSNPADNFDNRPASPNSQRLSSTQAMHQSQTSAMQSQSQLSQGSSHCLVGSLDLWHNQVVPMSAPEEREGTPCSNASCAPTERVSSREPSPWPTDGFDFSTAVYIPPMPKLNFPHAHKFATAEELSTILDHQEEKPDIPSHPLTPLLSPRSYALSLGLTEVDFAYVNFPGKTEYMAAQATKIAARQREAASKPRMMLHEPVPLASLYPQRYGRVLMPPPQPQQNQYPSPSTGTSPSLCPSSSRVMESSTEKGVCGPSAIGPSSSALTREKALILKTPEPLTTGSSCLVPTCQPSLAIGGPSRTSLTRTPLTQQPSLVQNHGPSAAGPSSPALTHQKFIDTGGSGLFTAGSLCSALTCQSSIVVKNRESSAASPSSLGLIRQPSVTLEKAVQSTACSSDAKDKIRSSKILNEEPKSSADVHSAEALSRLLTPPGELAKRKRDVSEILDQRTEPVTTIQQSGSSVKPAVAPLPLGNDLYRRSKRRKLSDER
ncbi:hypothetical protein FRB90_000335 [Tulasnella sp. 427]|nr:hypothetical protein FRB90_000335 [Tulasnella sp. 427]